VEQAFYIHLEARRVIANANSSNSDSMASIPRIKENNMKILENKLYIEDLRKTISNLDLTSLSGKTVLVTGGLGLICSSVVDLLYAANLGIKILVADINEPFFAERYGGYPNIQYVKYNALEPLNFDFTVDYIIHGAGLASPELYTTKPVETMTSNFNGVLNLLEYARSCGVKRLLYISSSEVYGNKSTDDAFIEDMFGSANINTVRASYYEAKRASEVLCRGYSSEYGVETVIVRPGHIYGPTASPRDRRISSDFAFKAARGEKLEMKSSGLQKRSYCYSLDCAAAMLVALTNGVVSESYNLGHDQVTTIRRMSEILAESGNVDLFIAEPTEAELKQFNPMNNSSLNNEKIKAIGYKDAFTVEEGLSHTVQIIKELYY